MHYVIEVNVQHDIWSTHGVLCRCDVGVATRAWQHVPDLTRRVRRADRHRPPSRSSERSGLSNRLTQLPFVAVAHNRKSMD